MTEPLKQLSPQDVLDGLADGTLLLIDVREPLEFAEARIPGALLFPLSTFDPRHLPTPGEKRLVFLCRSGQRSQSAFAHACEAGISAHGHLEGGLKAWLAAGYETVRSDPGTGQKKLTHS